MAGCLREWMAMDPTTQTPSFLLVNNTANANIYMPIIISI